MKTDEFFEKVKSIVNEEINRILSDKTVPKGYIRCAKCGSLIKEDSECKYCKEESVEKDNDSDGISLDDIVD